MEIDETMTEGLNTSDDSFADLTIYEEEPFVIPPAMVVRNIFLYNHNILYHNQKCIYL